MILRLALIGLAPLALAAGARPSPHPELKDLAFMSGCWEGTFQSRSGPTIIEEHYTTPSDNVMLGTMRYLREGRAVDYELTIIQQDSTGIALIPYPKGRRSEHDFRLTSLEGQRAIFEAPEHDFPKRIIYHREGDSITARIDGGAGDTGGREWALERVACH